MNIHDWKVSYGDEIVAQVLTFTRGVTSTKVLTKSLDGTVYIQTIGSGLKVASVTILCTTDEKMKVDIAESEGAVITVVYRDVTYIGYIEAAPSWEIVSPGEWYKANFTLLIEEEVSV